MIIYFEGLACAGKTTLVNYLAEHMVDVASVPELPKNYLELGKITNDFCRSNDERKCTEAIRLNKSHSYVLVDRCYASTLVYNYIQHHAGIPNEYVTTLNWFKSGTVTDKLVKPDLYIYLSLDSETSLKRAKTLNRMSTKYAWFIDPQTGINAYDFFFRFLEPDVPFLKISANIPIEEQLEIINQELIKYDK